MAEDSDLEKTEDPTSRRLEQAREKGQVPRSVELGTFLLLLVGAAALWAMGGWMTERAMMIMKKSLTMDVPFLVEPKLALLRLTDVSWDAVVSFSPLLALLIFAALLPPFLLNSFVFAPTLLEPDLKRMNPIAGIGRMFSWHGLAELLKSIGKSLLIGGVGAWVIWSDRHDIMGMLTQPLPQAISSMGNVLGFSFFMIVLSMLLIVVIDVPFQLWQHKEKLKMSVEEVKQEAKEMLGDPMIKGRIRALMREASRRRMMSAVPTADVIVTNPTHFAVALSYKTGMSAPKVLAKGMGEIAQKIKALGAEHGIPMLEAPPLARALYKHAELDAEIPGGLYAAVAEVLAYVFQLNRWKEVGGQYPMPPTALPVPPELVPEVA